MYDKIKVLKKQCALLNEAKNFLTEYQITIRYIFNLKKNLIYNFFNKWQIVKLVRSFGAGQSLDSADTHNFAILGCGGTYDK